MNLFEKPGPMKAAVFFATLFTAATAHAGCVREISIDHLSPRERLDMRLNGAYSLPGFGGYVLRASTHTAYEVEGHRLRDIGQLYHDDELRYLLRRSYNLADGSLVSHWKEPRGVYRQAKGETEWHLVAETEQVADILHDPVAGRVFVRNENADWSHEVSGQELISAHGFLTDQSAGRWTLNLRSSPELDGVFAKTSSNTGEELWFRPNSGDWEKIHLPDGVPVPWLHEHEFVYDGSLMRIILRGRAHTLTLKMKNGVPKVNGIWPSTDWAVHRQSGALLGWVRHSSPETNDLATALTNPPETTEKRDYRFHIGWPGEKDLQIFEDWRTRSAPGRPVELLSGDILIHYAGKLFVFDGSKIIPLLDLQPPEEGHRMAALQGGPVDVISTGENLFRVSPDRQVEPVETLPVSNSQLDFRPPSIVGSEQLNKVLLWLEDPQLYLLVSDGQVWTSEDMVAFEQVSLPEPIIHLSRGRIVGPYRTVLFGNSSLYVLDKKCQNDGDVSR